MKIKLKSFVILCFFLTAAFLCFSCTPPEKDETLAQLRLLLNDEKLTPQTRYAVINRIANSLYTSKKTGGMVLFLTDWVEKNPDDIYNAYWLLMVASSYLESGAEPVAEYYFNRILKNYPDLLVQGKSVHFLCLQHLIQISSSSANKISYFNQLINRFPSLVSITEMYVRLAMEYEKEGEYKEALKSYSLFLKQPDASTIQIPGIPDAYSNARKMVDFSNSTKDWTFESLDALETAVKRAIRQYDWRSLDKYRSKVNFFAMSWKSSETDANALENFSMRGFMVGQRIRYNEKLDESSNPNEAYLRTTGWSPYMPVWYLYFRKVNFPVDPEIHGRWEWAGIYYGEKL
ncbi:tol-pal system YbgF family protein [uncultured Treponema sp.]|uniref:tetratricopeptide repeat protein n=1 Tax=uncultured Treponema sp. TaxID=162155 RepID=UPI0015C06DD1|nr:tetratricopeptide repeat protein [uncultured Treponema sp.]